MWGCMAQRVLKELDVSINNPILLYCNNLSKFIYLAQNLVFRAWTKHIEVHYHMIRERDLAREHINANLQISDIFMKALGTDKVRQFSIKLGLRPTTCRTWGGVIANLNGESSIIIWLSLKGFVENQTQPSLMCEHTFWEYMYTQRLKVTTTFSTLNRCHRIIFYDT